jgi:DNA-directed RNA polymerase specialized sigma24 family protein
MTPDRTDARLRAMAQLVLGSRREADEAVEEAWLRLSRSDPSYPEDVRERLTALAARACLDRLRLRESQRLRASA